MKLFKYVVLYSLSFIPLTVLSNSSILDSSYNFTNYAFVLILLLPIVLHAILFYKKEKKIAKDMWWATGVFFIILTIAIMVFLISSGGFFDKDSFFIEWL